MHQAPDTARSQSQFARDLTGSKGRRRRFSLSADHRRGTGTDYPGTPLRLIEEWRTTPSRGPRPSPARRPRQRPGNVDDVVARRGRILLAPGNPKPDLQIDAGHRPKLEVAVRQVLRPLQRKADAETRDTSENVSSQL